MSKLLALFDLFRKGSMVADPVFWKTRQRDVNVLIPVLTALFSVASAFGYDLGVTDEQVAGLAIGLLAVINGVLTHTTTDKIGLPAKPDGAGVVPIQSDRRATDADVFHVDGG